MSELADGALDSHLTASQVLRQAREALGISQDQVAQELYLTPNYIRLIDSDEIDKIAKQAFVRGYLRSYAKMVNVDADDVVARFEVSQSGTPQKIEIRGVTQEAVGSTNFTGPVFQTGVLGLVGLVVVIALVWYLSSGEEEPVVVTSPEATLLESGDAVDEEASQDSDLESFEAFQNEINEPASDATLDALNSAEGSEEESTPEPVSTSTLTLTTSDKQSILDNMPETPATTDLSELSATGKRISIEREEGVVRVTAGGPDELRFLFTDECWVEIEDGDGDAIYGDLNRSGDELVVSGVAPFEVLFGKAPAVTLEFNGEPIDLAPHTTSVDTAKVKVGN
tara:strand:+ start:7024 stop:8040 length:1017 start_codon:yes stop_codon:yes gene_type:complete